MAEELSKDGLLKKLDCLEENNIITEAQNLNYKRVIDNIRDANEIMRYDAQLDSALSVVDFYNKYKVETDRILLAKRERMQKHNTADEARKYVKKMEEDVQAAPAKIEEYKEKIASFENEISQSKEAMHQMLPEMMPDILSIIDDLKEDIEGVKAGRFQRAFTGDTPDHKRLDELSANKERIESYLQKCKNDREAEGYQKTLQDIEKDIRWTKRKLRDSPDSKDSVETLTRRKNDLEMMVENYHDTEDFPLIPWDYVKKYDNPMLYEYNAMVSKFRNNSVKRDVNTKVLGGIFMMAQNGKKLIREAREKADALGEVAKKADEKTEQLRFETMTKLGEDYESAPQKLFETKTKVRMLFAIDKRFEANLLRTAIQEYLFENKESFLASGNCPTIDEMMASAAAKTGRTFEYEDFYDAYQLRISALREAGYCDLAPSKTEKERIKQTILKKAGIAGGDLDKLSLGEVQKSLGKMIYPHYASLREAVDDIRGIKEVETTDEFYCPTEHGAYMYRLLVEHGVCLAGGYKPHDIKRMMCRLLGDITDEQRTEWRDLERKFGSFQRPRRLYKMFAKELIVPVALDERERILTIRPLLRELANIEAFENAARTNDYDALRADVLKESDNKPKEYSYWVELPKEYKEIERKFVEEGSINTEILSQFSHRKAELRNELEQYKFDIEKMQQSKSRIDALRSFVENAAHEVDDTGSLEKMKLGMLEKFSDVSLTASFVEDIDYLVESYNNSKDDIQRTEVAIAIPEFLKNMTDDARHALRVYEFLPKGHAG